MMPVFISERRIVMPYYRSGNDEYRRKPKMNYEKDYEPNMDDEEEEDTEKEPMKEPAKEKKPYPPKKHDCFCKVECPFKVIVKVVPCCEEHKEHECD
jgi:hypothetical protein